MKTNYLKLKFTSIFLFVLSFPLWSQDFTDSNLPIVIINTDFSDGQPQEIVDDPRVLATMKIIFRPEGARNYVADQNNDEFLEYNGRISIEVRGSTSQMLDKKGYGLTTLEDDDVSNNNVSLFGMPSENDWILNGLAYDSSLIRDYLSYNLSAMLGNYAPRTKYCELVINGDYRGLYVFTEKIKADSGRVNVLKMTPQDNSGELLTGGFITKSDKTTGGDPQAWVMASYNGTTEFVHDLPKPEDITTQQHTFIRSQFIYLASDANLNNSQITDGYPATIDIPTFVDFMIINELASNADAYQISTYFHKDRNGKLRAGPVWDHNLTYGNDLFMFGLDRSHFDVWQFDNDDNTGPKFWKDLYDDPAFRCLLARRFAELTSPGQVLYHENIAAFIDEIAAEINEAAEREEIRWSSAPDPMWEMDAIKLFLDLRIEWMTEVLGGFDACSDPDLPPLVISRINYNPGTSPGFTVANDQEFIEIRNAGTEQVDLTGIYFRELGISYKFPDGSIAQPGESIFLAANPAIFQQKHGVPAFGKFTRNLSNRSQKLLLADAFGNTIDSVTYLDEQPWPDVDGNGSYLQLTDVLSDNSLAENWVASNTIALSTDAIAAVPSLKIYPNPVGDRLTIETESEIYKIELYDITGRKVYESENIVGGIDFTAFASGIFVLKVDGINGIRTFRIVHK